MTAACINPANLLEVQNLSIAYESGVVVDDVSFDVRRGEFFCIVGANGSGKSTLIRGILGLLPILRGKIRMSAPHEEVGYVPQLEKAELEFPATAWEIVLTGTQKKGRRIPFYTAQDKKAAAQAMDNLGITDLAKAQIGKLSGGQRQRVLLARAMCRNPSLLFMDEPCAGLDSDTKQSFYGLLSNLHKAGDSTFVMVSHDWDEVADCADRVAVMASRLVFTGGVSEWQKGDWKLSLITGGKGVLL